MYEAGRFCPQGSTEAEWKQLQEAAKGAGRKCAELADHTTRAQCALVMDFVPGKPLFQQHEAFQAPKSIQTAAQLGRYEALSLFLTRHVHFGLMQD